MDLHRSGKQPDWDVKPYEELSPIQKVAKNTHGIITPGNMVSIVGAFMVGKGLYDIKKGNTLKGLLYIGAGRTADILDGAIASKTETKSAFGEMVDASLDKAEIIAALPILVKYKVIPLHTALFAGGQNIINASLALLAKRLGAEVHPSQSGKFTTLFQWCAVGIHGFSAVAHEYDHEALGDGITLAADTLEAASIVIGTMATFGYIKDTFGISSD
ncbi:MAG: hypothetical protein NVSMB46_02360 [Candidatus Saccharimonadales bacterium]